MISRNAEFFILETVERRRASRSVPQRLALHMEGPAGAGSAGPPGRWPPRAPPALRELRGSAPGSEASRAPSAPAARVVGSEGARPVAGVSASASSICPRGPALPGDQPPRTPLQGPWS